MSFEDLKDKKALDMTLKIYHDLSDISKVKEPNKAVLLDHFIKTMINDAHISYSDGITILKNVLLNTIYEGTKGFLDNEEQEQQDKFRNEFK